MINIMLDLETMGVNFDAPIIAIGACYFDPRTGEIGEKFYKQVALSSNGVIDAATVIWWMQQPDAARAKFKTNMTALPLEYVLKDFAGFCKSGVKVWGNGSDFDNAILAHAYKCHKIEQPWHYWNSRCVRTMVDLCNVDVGKIPFTGTKHYALDDAIHQVKYIHAATLTGIL